MFNAFFASGFNKRLVIFGVPKNNCPKLEDRDREQKEVPLIQEEMVSEQLHQLATQRSIGPDGIHPRVQKETAQVLREPLSITYQQYWIRGRSLLLEVSKCEARLQEGLEGDSREEQACQPA